MARLKEGQTRTYTVPLRREFLKAPKWRRSKRAVASLKEFLAKHTKKDNIRLSRWINEYIWKHGGKNPPGKIKVDVKVEGDKAIAELSDLSARAKRLIELEAKQEAEKKKKAEKKEETLPEKLEEVKPAVKEKAKKGSKKAEKKASKKELQKELEAAKEAEKKRAEKKKVAPPTKQQDIKSAKH